jgi:hypothetical protein
MATIRVKRSTGSTAPSIGGITFGEPAFVDGINSLYIAKNNANIVRIGAEVSGATALGASDDKIPTQNAVKTYVDAALAGVGSVVFSTIAVSGQSNIVADTTGDTLTFAAGTGITLTTDAGSDTLTIGNIGVTSLSGTSNEIEVSASTGSVQVGLPNDVTITNNLTVGGNLTVNGTTTTVNSDVTTVDDPMMLLGTSGGLPIAVSDGGKDRGVAFTYFSGSGKTGFFGLDASASKFTFVPDATISGDIVTAGNAGDAQFKDVYLYNGTYTGQFTLGSLTANKVYTLPDTSGTLITTGDTGTVTSTMIANNTIVDADINSSAAIADTKLATITATDKVSLSALNIDGGTDIGAALSDADLIIVDDGGAGANRKAAVTRISDYVFSKITGGDITIASNGVATIAANSVALGTDTTGNYVATISSSSTGLNVQNSGTENAAVTIDFATITTGLNMGTFSFATGEFTNSFGTVSIGTVDGGSF